MADSSGTGGGAADGGAAGGPGRGRPFGRRGDLRGRPFPTITAADRIEAVDQLRDWAEVQVQDAIDWYLRDKAKRRTGSRLLRGATVVLVAAGGIAPLVNVARGGDAGGWGYVLLAAAAGCAAFDHFFGVSSGWMRDMAAAQGLQRRLTDFRLEWTAELLRPESDETGTGVTDALLGRRLDLVRRLVADMVGMVEAETAEWLAEFRTTMGTLYGQVGLNRQPE